LASLHFLPPSDNYHSDLLPRPSSIGPLMGLGSCLFTPATRYSRFFSARILLNCRFFPSPFPQSPRGEQMPVRAFQDFPWGDGLLFVRPTNSPTWETVFPSPPWTRAILLEAGATLIPPPFLCTVASVNVGVLLFPWRVGLPCLTVNKTSPPTSDFVSNWCIKIPFFPSLGTYVLLLDSVCFSSFRFPFLVWPA